MESLVHGLLGNAAAVTVLAAAVAIAGRLCRRPALIHSVCLLAMLKLVTPPIVSVPMPGAAAHRFVDPPAPVLLEPADPPLAPVGSDAEPAGTPLPDDFDGDWQPVETVLEDMPEAAPASWGWEAVALAMVLFGALAWWTLAAVRIVRFHRLLRDVEPMPAEWQAGSAALAARLGLRRPPSACLVPGDVPPMLWAFGPRVRLLLPSRLWLTLGDDERTALLLHEMAHLRRRDHWVRWFELAVVGLYWWHPAVWWNRRMLREAEEQCCDAWVVWAMPQGGARTYAAALVAALEFVSGSRTAPAAAASATVGSGHVSSLKRRLRMIVRAKTPKGLSWAGRLAVAGLSALLLPLAPTWMPKDATAAPYAELDHELQAIGDRIAVDLQVIEAQDRPGAEQPKDQGGKPREAKGDDKDEPRKDARGRDGSKRAEKESKDLKEKLGDDLDPLAEAIRKALSRSLDNVQQALKKDGMKAEDLQRALEKSREDLRRSLRQGGSLDREMREAAERARKDLQEKMERSLNEALRSREEMKSRTDEAREQQKKMRAEEQADRQRQMMEHRKAIQEGHARLRREMERQREELERQREVAQERARERRQEQKEARPRPDVPKAEEKPATGEREKAERNGAGREELDTARQQIRELREQLREANGRLERLRREEARRPETPARPETPKASARPETPQAPARPAEPRPAAPSARPEAPGDARDRGDYDRRVRELEDRMERLLKELQEIKGRAPSR